MGGINHQPCRAYLPNSTALSRALTLANAHFLLSNVALEDIILNELGIGDIAEPEAIIRNLGNSRTELSKMKSSIHNLRVQMRENDFKDLATAGDTNLTKLGLQFHIYGLHVPNSDWAIAATTMAHVGFTGMLDIFDQRIDELDTLTELLTAKVGSWIQQTNVGERHVALEENEPTNFKVEFAQLFTAWASFQQIFLASSLISTELWYRDQNLGSLIGEPAFAQMAA
jgi:hypothetical protein